MRLPLIEVAAAIVCRPDGRVLLAERTPGQTGAGCWELPGGKIEAGEEESQAAARELAAEAGVVARSMRPAALYEHVYRTRRVRTHFFRVERWSGTPLGHEGQRLAWVDPAQPEVSPVLPSNERILRALGLPDLYADCRRPPGASMADRLMAVGDALAAGARLLRVAGTGLTSDQRVCFARRAQDEAARHGAQVLLDGEVAVVRRAALPGMHTCTQQLHRLLVRPAVRLWIASCHDERDLAHAIHAGADAVVVSPVLAEDGASRIPALGWDRLAALAALSNIPVYAQGGLPPEARATALAHGAIGIACPMPAQAVAKFHSARRRSA